MEAMPYSSFLAWLAQIPRIRRRHMADMAWAMYYSTRAKAYDIIRELEQ